VLYQGYHPDNTGQYPDHTADNGQVVAKFNSHSNEDKPGKNKSGQPDYLTGFIDHADPFTKS
jgi:hypothetical protein